jgi:hypothetical protein
MKTEGLDTNLVGGGKYMGKQQLQTALNIKQSPLVGIALH